MTEFDESPGRTRRDPGTTSVDRAGGAVPPPRGGGGALVRLPGALAERFDIVGELPVQGAESDLVHVVERESGAEYVVKVYRRGYQADPEVWRKLPELASPHVVRIAETGHADGRDYEVIDYLPAGNLRGLMAGPMTAEMVTDVVGQLADGVVRLHSAGIVHRDLKPENVLIAETAPLRLVIADFGLSRVIEQSVVFASSSRTLAYAAPESLSGQVSPARDWWSLGMIVRELATGRPPFQGMSETVVVDHLATRGIDNGDIRDARLKLLCEGLLTRDPRKRWGGTQVREWLAGASPEVVPESRQQPPDVGHGLLFNRRRFDNRGDLARALVERWSDGARYFFGRGERGEAWRALREWLEETGDDSRIELIDAHLTADLPPDVKLLHLVRWLDPELPPYYLGVKLAREDLPGLAGLASDPTHPDHDLGCRIGRDLWAYDLLPDLGEAELARNWQGRVSAWNTLVAGLRPHLTQRVAQRLPDAGRLPEAARWSDAGRPPEASGRLPGGGRMPGGTRSSEAGGGLDAGRFPGSGGLAEVGRYAGAGGLGVDEPPVVLLSLLALAADPGYAGPALAEAVAQARGSLAEPVEWFGWLVDGAGDDPLRLLAALQTHPEAVAEAEAAVRRRATEQRTAEARAQQWQQREHQRLTGVDAATKKAVLWSLPVLALWLFGSWLVDGLFGGSGGGTTSVGSSQGAKGLPLLALVVGAFLAWGVELGAEIVVARQQGSDYLPYGPWAWLSKVLGIGGRGLSKAGRAISGRTRSQNPRGCGFILLAGVLPMIVLLLLFSVLSALAEFLWIMVLLAVPVVHAVTAGLRLHRWREAHEKTMREALG